MRIVIPKAGICDVIWFDEKFLVDIRDSTVCEADLFGSNIRIIGIEEGRTEVLIASLNSNNKAVLIIEVKHSAAIPHLPTGVN